MTANLERLMQEHGQATLADLDAEIARCIEQLRELHRRRSVVAMHLAVAAASAVVETTTFAYAGMAVDV